MLLNKPLSQLLPSSNLLGDYHFVFRNKLKLSTVMNQKPLNLKFN